MREKDRERNRIARICCERKRHCERYRGKTEKERERERERARERERERYIYIYKRERDRELWIERSFYTERETEKEE